MALVAGKLVFFLTFVPSIDDCAAGGDAYLYILNYTGNPLSKDPLDGSGFIKKADGTSPSSLKVGEYTKTDNKTYVAKVSESGVPSQPVLDSSNQYVLIQTSDAKIHKIKVNLEGSPLTIKGWKEEELENP
jgi:type IV pilus assembly protein PilY1